MHPDDLPADFFDDTHFPDCATQTDNLHPWSVTSCDCDAIEVDMRDAFAEMTRECY